MNTIINFETFFIKYLCIHITTKTESFKHEYKQYRNFINLVISYRKKHWYYTQFVPIAMKLKHLK